MDASAVFAQAGATPPESPRSANVRHAGNVMERLWVLGVEATADPCFGLEVGRRWHPTSFHALGYVALASASLNEALTYLVRYSRIVSAEAVVSLEPHGEHVSLKLAERTAPVPRAAFARQNAVLAGLAAVATLCRVARGSAVTFERVALKQQTPCCRERVESFFACAVLYGAEEDALVFARPELSAPLPGASTELVQLNQGLAAGHLAELESQPFAHEVRAHIARLLPSGRANQQAVARALRMGQRSLQRRLQLENASFRRVLDDTRRELAQGYFKDPTLATAEVAYLLGFSETSSLSRAMRRWGLTAR
ncbi:MAG TPA: AraC family transcriptional regulator ligand-binding domain-containing protein [Steroidobacteraceae bacterium]|nr:AraC family transcriptional regulator ligand-binding domain-containing protein [Steroidobacteraceae bacterium]